MFLKRSPPSPIPALVLGVALGCVEPGEVVSDASSETSAETSTSATTTEPESGTDDTQTSETQTGPSETSDTDTADTTGDGDGDTGDGDTGDGDTGDTGDGDGDTGDTGDGDGDGDTGDGDGDDPEGLCGYPPERTMVSLIAQDQLTVSLLRNDETVIMLDTSLPAALDDADIRLLMDARGESVFTAVYDHLGGSLEHNRAHYRLHDRDTGALVWERADDIWEPDGRPPFVSSDGRAAFFAYSPYDESDNSYSLVIGAGGEIIDEFIGVASGVVMPDDWLAIEVGESFPRFRNVITKQEVGLDYAIWDDYKSLWIRDQSLLIYLSSINGAFHVVEQHAEEVTLRPWPEIEPYLAQGWNVYSMGLRGDGHHVLLELRNNGARRYLHLGADDTSDDVQMIPPLDHTSVDCISQPVVGADGELITLWRDASSARIWTLIGPDDDWAVSDLALPIHGFAGVTLAAISTGTYWLRANESGSCPGIWDLPPNDALIGNSTQIMRPAAQAFVSFDYAADLRISPEGRCYARSAAVPEDPWLIEDLEAPGSIAVPEFGVLRWIPN